MKVKEIIRSINYDCFALFFPKHSKLIEIAKTFDIDFLEPIEIRYPKDGKKIQDNYYTGIPVMMNYCYDETTIIDFEDLTVLEYKLMEIEELKTTIFKHRLWSIDDDLNLYDEKWLCILVEDNKMG